LGENIYTIQKNTESLLDAGKEVGLEVNLEKTKNMLMPRKKARQKQSIKIANTSFEDVADFKYLGITLTDQNSMNEEIKSKLNSGNAGYHSVPVGYLLNFPDIPIGFKFELILQQLKLDKPQERLLHSIPLLRSRLF
jgi:hypothetical protein